MNFDLEQSFFHQNIWPRTIIFSSKYFSRISLIMSHRYYIWKSQSRYLAKIWGGSKWKPLAWVFKVDQKIFGFPEFIRNTFNRVCCYCLKYVTIIVIQRQSLWYLLLVNFFQKCDILLGGPRFVTVWDRGGGQKSSKIAWHTLWTLKRWSRANPMCSQKKDLNSEFVASWLQEIPFSKELTDNHW